MYLQESISLTTILDFSNNLPGLLLSHLSTEVLGTKVGLTANEVMFQTPEGDQVFYRKFRVTNYT